MIYVCVGMCVCSSEWLLGDFIAHFLLYILQWLCILHHVLPFITLTALQRALRCHPCYRSIIKIAGWYSQQRAGTVIYYCCSLSNGPGAITTTQNNGPQLKCLYSTVHIHTPLLLTLPSWVTLVFQFAFMAFILKETCWWDQCDMRSHRHALCNWLIFMFYVVLSL